MKAITFLGAGPAYDTAYVLEDGREHVAPYFGAALARFYPGLTMRVFVTPEAKEKHYKLFLKRVEDHVDDIEAVDIPGGADEAQLWTIFETVIDAVDEREDVVFDITHGFRSLPFLSFLAASYLRVIKQINLVSVLYGNFEARDQTVSPHRAPVIDLTPFVSLLDWMVAADRFIRFGDAQDLATQIKAASPGPEELRTNRDARRVNTDLGSAAKALDDVSKALRMIRPMEAIRASAQLETVLLNASSAISQNARPFLPLARQVMSAYAGLGMPAEMIASDPIATLSKERTMVIWYMERRQYVQAVAVAREWLVSWTMLALGFGDRMLDRQSRLDSEHSLGHFIYEMRIQRVSTNYKFPETEPLVEQLRQYPNIDRVAQIFGRIGDMRNDLLHAGKNTNAIPAKTLERNILEVSGQLDQIPLPVRQDTTQ